MEQEGYTVWKGGQWVSNVPMWKCSIYGRGCENDE